MQKIEEGKKNNEVIGYHVDEKKLKENKLKAEKMFEQEFIVNKKVKDRPKTA